MPSFERVENPLSGLSASFLQSAVCIICLQEADKFHTCSLIGVFVHVHAAAENLLYFVFRLREKFCEAFLTV